MRKGDFGVDVVPAGGRRVQELDSGHVLARPGTVYRIRLRNFGPLRCVADVRVDGHRVTAGGLVLNPWGTCDLERPVDAGENGCFTVVAEGDETVFGPDGGRDSESLGAIEAGFRRELPRTDRAADPPVRPLLGTPPVPAWVPPRGPAISPARTPVFQAIAVPNFVRPEITRLPASGDAIERAAGTGLSGHSNQEFEPIELGPLEAETTLIQLRLVIGSPDSLGSESTHFRDPADEPPARPAARP